MSWYVLTTKDRLYAGQIWEVINNTPRRPRAALGPLESSLRWKPTLCHGREWAHEECRRFQGILGMAVKPVSVTFVGLGQKTIVELFRGRREA